MNRFRYKSEKLCHQTRYLRSFDSAHTSRINSDVETTSTSWFLGVFFSKKIIKPLRTGVFECFLKFNQHNQLEVMTVK